ncbi:uncharacterized protein DUF4349 [Paenibacillus taihuensis]|uniref:Uncharacterized protein DUF4349 n=1 Tax=Paenibacillus taihuensis TaxID=1156355 RepID=A0A3D9SDM9_9BACL|nr:DUF4349 domain-containing protein [Paenibacillus taihuensis]REE92998.1 uncharacterized protein DUF4349 [Paenibacillus taihuensis]
MNRQRMKWLVLIGLVVMLVGMLAGCSANSNSNDASSAAMDGAVGTNANMKADATMNDTTMDTSASSQVASESAAAPAVSTDTSADSVGAVDSGSSSEETTAPVDAIDRKIIYRANVNMEVEDFDKAHTSLENLIHLSGGYLLKFADKKTTSELGGTYTVKVPASGFNGFITELQKMKHVSFESSAEGTDVTQEYVDLEARLKARKVVEERLLSFMEKATKTTDLLAISKQLGDVQTEIEQIKGRMKYLDNNVAYSTIDLRMYQVLEPEPQVLKEDPKFVERIKDAMTGSTNVIYAFFQGLVIFIAGALPVLVILVIIGIPLYLVYRSNRRKSQLTANVPNTPAPGAVLLEERKEESEENK